MALTAHELLAEVAAEGEDLETVARGLLARLAELTGLSSTYLAETRLNEDEQRILFSYNTSEVFHIPEDISLPWSEGVCRFVVEGGPNYTIDAQKVFPKAASRACSRSAPSCPIRCSPPTANGLGRCAERVRTRSTSK